MNPPFKIKFLYPKENTIIEGTISHMLVPQNLTLKKQH